MAPYEAFDPETEINGRTVLVVVDGALARFSEEYQARARDALAENGIEDPKHGEWYPQQAWLDTFETIASELESHILDRLGEQIPDVADWPTDPTTVPEGLQAIDVAYQRNHRNGEIGYYDFEQTGEQEGVVTCHNPYPCELDRGLIRATAQRHAPVESFVFVEEHEETCRRNGDDTCAYTVSW